MPAINLGRVGFVNHGDYSGSYTYKVNSVVKYNKSLYVSKSETIGNLPTNTGYWDVWIDTNNLPYTPSGDIAANTVQGAISELDTEKAPKANPTFTGTVAGIDKTMVGLANVDNTSDANKPVSSATQTALNLKANIASPTFTGTVTAPVIKNTQAVVTTTPASTVEFFYRSNATNGILTALSATAFKAWLESIGATGMQIKNTVSMSFSAASDATTIPFSISNIAKVFITLNEKNGTSDSVSGFIGAYNDRTIAGGARNYNVVQTSNGTKILFAWVRNSNTIAVATNDSSVFNGIVTIVEYE